MKNENLFWSIHELKIMPANIRKICTKRKHRVDMMASYIHALGFKPKWIHPYDITHCYAGLINPMPNEDRRDENTLLIYVSERKVKNEMMYTNGIHVESKWKGRLK